MIALSSPAAARIVQQAFDVACKAALFLQEKYGQNRNQHQPERISGDRC